MRRLHTVLVFVFVILAILGYAAAFLSLKVWYDQNFYRIDFSSGPFKSRAFTVSAGSVERLTQLLSEENVWQGVDSIEQAHPEVAAGGKQPYYYMQLQQGKELCDQLGFLKKPAVLIPYGQLSEQERFLLARSTPEVGEESEFRTAHYSRDWTILELIDRTVSQLSLKEAPNPFSRSDVAVQAAFNTLAFSYWREEELSRDEWLMLTAKRCVNPLSGRVVNLSSKEFSPGDCYCELILDDTKLEAMRDKDRELKTTYYPDRWPDFCYAYYRIYGKHALIAEGLLRVHPKGYKVELQP